MRMRLLVGLVWTIQAAAASATTVITYDASLGSQVLAPNLQNPAWFPFGVTSGGASPVVDDLGQGISAWNITASPLGATPVYSYGLLPLTEHAARSQGWRLSASARFVSDLSSYGGTGLTAFWNNRAYFLLFDLTPTGTLVATHDGISDPLPLTPVGTGSHNYHDLELRWSPGSDEVEFWFDGELKRSWSGLPSSHANTVQFGHFTNFGQGSMNFASVRYEVGPFSEVPQLTGDFNGDGAVDAADYTIWRNTLGTAVEPYSGADADGSGWVGPADYILWKRQLGPAQGALAEASAAVPEPAALAPLLLGACCGLAAWRSSVAARRRRQI